MKSAGVKVGTIGSIEVEKGVAKVGLVLDEEVLPYIADDVTFTDLDPAVLEDIVLGCAYPEASQGNNLARRTGAAYLLDGGPWQFSRPGYFSQKTEIDFTVARVGVALYWRERWPGGRSGSGARTFVGKKHTHCRCV